MSASSFLTISALVRQLADAARARGAGPPPSDLRAAAAELALRHFGAELALEQPATINLAALSLAALSRTVVHQVRPLVGRLVDATDLHSLPGAPPRLLRRPWILEVRRPETGERLFGDVVNLAGYSLDGVTYLIALRYPDGVAVVRWRPAWGEQDLAAGVARDDSPLIDDVDAHEDLARAAARFAVVLGLLLDAEGAPLRLDEEREELPRPRAPGPRPAAPPPAWITRHLYLDERRTRGRWGEGDGASGAATGGADADKMPEEVDVKGHLKRQPCGPGGRERKWIYVERYEARRWVAPRPVRVVVARKPGD